MMFFGVIDFVKQYKSYVCHRGREITLNKYFLTQKSLFYHNLFSNNG